MHVRGIDLAWPLVDLLEILLQVLLLFGARNLIFCSDIEEILGLLSAAFVEVVYAIGQTQVPFERVVHQTVVGKPQQHSLAAIADHLRTVGLGGYRLLSVEVKVHTLFPEDFEFSHQHNVAVLFRLRPSGLQPVETGVLVCWHFLAHLQ